MIDSRVRPGILVNPHSRLVRLQGDAWLRKALQASPVALAFSRSLEQVPVAVQDLVDAGCNILITVGGDGSLHHALNAIMRLNREYRPILFPLTAGSMNMVTRALGQKTAPMKSLSVLLKQLSTVSMEELKVIEQPLLQVQSSAGESRWGMIFGSALTARALELQEQDFGGGYLGLFRLLRAVSWGVVSRNQFWQRHQHLLQESVIPISVDGQEMQVLAAVSSTLDIQLARGWLTGFRAGQLEHGFRVRTLENLSARQLVACFPYLALGRPGKGIRDWPEVKDLHFEGDFSLEGEVFPGTHGQRLVLSREKLKILQFVKAETKRKRRFPSGERR